jgi:uncharacterized peroxidase-related enzyme
MSRITLPATVEDASEAARPILKGVGAKFGAVPNVFRLVSNSPAALNGLLGLAGALGGGRLDNATRERIALAIANVNGCDYCNAAHTASGRMAKLDTAEIEAARRGGSNDPRAEVAVRFARKVAVTRAQVSEADIVELRLAGYDAAQIVEIVFHVGLNTLTNYVNEVFGTPVDFPAAGEATRAA